MLKVFCIFRIFCIFKLVFYFLTRTPYDLYIVFGSQKQQKKGHKLNPNNHINCQIYFKNRIRPGQVYNRSRARPAEHPKTPIRPCFFPDLRQSRTRMAISTHKGPKLNLTAFSPLEVLLCFWVYFIVHFHFLLNTTRLS